MDKIDVFPFVRLDEPPPMVCAKIGAHTRPGTDGVTLHNLGTWAEPFTTRSLATASNIAAAYQLYEAYRFLVGQPPVSVVWANIALNLAKHRFYVLDVVPLDFRSLVVGTGPQGLYFAEAECQWTLQPIVVG